jgi:hypothetical protein
MIGLHDGDGRLMVEVFQNAETFSFPGGLIRPDGIMTGKIPPTRASAALMIQKSMY